MNKSDEDTFVDCMLEADDAMLEEFTGGELWINWSCYLQIGYEKLLWSTQV